MTPLVTIAIPTYERLQYLMEAVASAEAQTYDNIEILIGDDGNNPEIQVWCNQQAQRNPKIRYQKNSRNLGLAGNWNALADTARGDYIIIIGDDDRLLPDFVSKCIAVVLPDGAVAFSNQIIIDHEGHRLDEETQKLPRLYGRDALQAGWLSNPEVCAWRNSIPSSAALIRTADVRRLRFKEDMNTPELELFVRLAAEGVKFAFVPDCLAEYRVHPKSATSGGLKSDILVEHLMNVSVRPEVEAHKATLLAKQMVNAVSRCLVAGNRDKARRLFTSKYYPPPERKRIRGWLQRLAIVAPRIAGIKFYQLIWRTKSHLADL